MKKIRLYLLLLFVVFFTGCSSNIQELEMVKDKHNKEVEYIITQQEVNKDMINKFKVEVLDYISNKRDIKYIDTSKIRIGENTDKVLEEVKAEVEKEINTQIESYTFMESLDEESNNSIDKEEIRNNYIESVRGLVFQDLKTGEVELIVIYPISNGGNGILSSTWIEGIGYNIKNTLIR